MFFRIVQIHVQLICSSEQNSQFFSLPNVAKIIYHLTPSDPCLTDLDRILTEGQDPGAQQYLVLGTVPIKGKNLGFWVPMHLLY